MSASYKTPQDARNGRMLCSAQVQHIRLMIDQSKRRDAMRNARPILKFLPVPKPSLGMRLLMDVVYGGFLVVAAKFGYLLAGAV